MSAPPDMSVVDDRTCPVESQFYDLTDPDTEADGGWGMSCDNRTIRLAFGLFNGLCALERVFADFALLDRNAEKFCLIGHDHALSLVRPPDVTEAKAGSWQHHFGEIRKLQSARGVLTCMASAGSVFEDVCGEVVAAFTDGDRCPPWLSERQYQRLNDHMAEGGVVLVVSSATPAQQDSISRVLLRYSENGVQTHDFCI